MRYSLLFILVATFSFKAQSAELLDGYIVMINNDTIQCKIKSGRFLNNPFKGITIIDEKGEEQSFTANDKKITAFGFVEKTRSYHYFFIAAGNNNEHGFYQRLVNGLKYKLYSRIGQVQGDGVTYVLFNPSGEFVKFKASLINPWKKQLRELLKDDPKALPLVEKAKPHTIPQFVLEINKL